VVKKFIDIRMGRIVPQKPTKIATPIKSILP
jgi:hypothetical protein